jgi:sister-chromatid-cohesion protein PDS5
MDSDEDWYEDYRMPPEIVAKLYSLKVCRNRCLAMSKSDVASDIAKPVLKMLLTVLANKGSFDANVDEEYVSLLEFELRL